MGDCDNDRRKGGGNGGWGITDDATTPTKVKTTSPSRERKNCPSIVAGTRGGRGHRGRPQLLGVAFARVFYGNQWHHLRTLLSVNPVPRSQKELVVSVGLRGVIGAWESMESVGHSCILHWRPTTTGGAAAAAVSAPPPFPHPRIFVFDREVTEGEGRAVNAFRQEEGTLQT